MKENIFTEAGIIQKPIPLNIWKLVAASKGYCRTIKQAEYRSSMEVVQEYLKNELLCNLFYLDYASLYNFLLEAVFYVFDVNTIKNIFQNDLKNKMNPIGFLNNFKDQPSVLSYKDLCEMLIERLQLLQIRESIGNKSVDLFVIFTEEGKFISIDEAEEEWLKENFTKKINKQEPN